MSVRDNAHDWMFQHEDCNGVVQSVSFDADCMKDIVGHFGHFLLGAGFQPATVAKYLNHEYFELPDNEEK